VWVERPSVVGPDEGVPDPASLVRITCGPSAVETHPVISPDGRQVAYASTAGPDGRFHIFVVSIPAPGGTCADVTPVQVTSGATNDLWPAWMDDNQDGTAERLVFSRAGTGPGLDPLGDLYTLDVTGLPLGLPIPAPVRLTNTPGVAESQPTAMWSFYEGDPGTYGESVVFTTTRFRSDGSLASVRVDGTPTVYTTYASLWNEEEIGHIPQSSEAAAVQGSAATTWIAFTTTEDDTFGDVRYAAVPPAATSEPTLDYFGTGFPGTDGTAGTAESHPAWILAPDDDIPGALWLTRRTHAADIVSVPASAGTPVGTIVGTATDESTPSYSIDGRIAYSERRGVARYIRYGPLDGSQPMTEIPMARNGAHANDKNVQPVWSPDGRRIAFVNLRSAGGNWAQGELWVFTPATGELTMIAQPPDPSGARYTDSDPTWSPDGRRIAFTRSFAGPADLEIDITLSTATIVEGATATATVTITNNGTRQSHAPQVTVEIPAGLTSSTSPQFCTNSAGTVSCTFPPLAAGASRSFELVVGGTNGPTPRVITARVAGGVTPDPDTSNNEDTAELSVTARPDYRFVSFDVPDGQAAAEPVPTTITAVIANDGGTTTGTARVRIFVATGPPAPPVAARTPLPAGCVPVASSTDVIVDCDIAPIPAGQTTTVTLPIEGAVDSYNADAFIFNVPFESNTANNGAAADTYTLSLLPPDLAVAVQPVNRAALDVATTTMDVVVTNDVGAGPAPGSTFTFSIAAINQEIFTGTSRDTGPTFVRNTAGCTWNGPPTRTATCTLSGTIAPGASRTITFTIADDGDAGTVTGPPSPPLGPITYSLGATSGQAYTVTATNTTSDAGPGNDTATGTVTFSFSGPASAGHWRLDDPGPTDDAAAEKASPALSPNTAAHSRLTAPTGRAAVHAVRRPGVASDRSRAGIERPASAGVLSAAAAPALPAPLAVRDQHGTVADYADPEIWTVTVQTGSTAPVREDCSTAPCAPIRGRQPDWSPTDPVAIAYVRQLDSGDERGIAVLTLTSATANTVTGDPRMLTGFRDDDTPTSSRAAISSAEDPDWSPTGQQIAITGQPTGQPDQRGIYVINAATGALAAPTPRVQGRGPETDPDWEPYADLAAALSATPGTITAGTTSTLVAAVTNKGPSRAANVTLTILVPTGLGVVTTSLPSGCTLAAATVACHLGVLSAKPTVPVTRVFKVRGNIPGSYGVTAKVASDTLDDVPGNNTASATLNVQGLDLRVRITPKFERAWVGGKRTVNVVVQNNGPSTAASVQLKMVVPGQLGATAAQPCLVGIGTCSLGNLTAGSARTFVITMALPKAAVGDRTISAQVSNAVTDTNLANNRDQMRFTVELPTLRFLPAVAEPGEAVTLFGEHFPPNVHLKLSYDNGKGILSGPDTVKTDADGEYAGPLLVLRRDQLGTRTLIATSVASTPKFQPTKADLLVVPRRLAPPDFLGRG
jgi:Tol biopolymer transport system component